MLLYPQPSHKWVPTLGSKDHPIPVDSDSEIPQLSHPHPPLSKASGISLPQPPFSPAELPGRKQPRSNGKTQSSTMNVTQTRMSAQSELLIAEPMILYDQDLLGSQSLKRKRDATPGEDDSQTEAAKRFRKTEKKRRKRERRAARLGQLGSNMPHGWLPSNNAGWDMKQPPHLRVNFNVLPGHPSSWHDTTQSVSGMPNFPAMSFPGSGTEGMEDVQGSTYVNHDVQHSFESITPPLPYSDVAPPSIAASSVLAAHATPQNQPISRDTSQPTLRMPYAPEDHQMSSSSSDGRPDLHGAFISDTEVSTTVSTSVSDISLPQPTSTGSSALNRLLHARMESLVQHRRLGLEANPTSQPGFPPPPPPFVSVEDTIAVKQTLLDNAISENKAVLTQLGGSVTKEQKSILMKNFIERNKFITQLTSEIKAHYESCKRSTAHSIHVVRNEAPSFKWPETHFPIYVDLSSDSEESDCES